MAVISPFIKAKPKGVPIQAGTKYKRAGWACLKTCITKIVAISPKKYATIEAWKYVLVFLFKLWSNLSKRAMKIPGITMSPSPNMAKLFAERPFWRRSCGNTTATKIQLYVNLEGLLHGVEILQKKNQN